MVGPEHEDHEKTVRIAKYTLNNGFNGTKQLFRMPSEVMVYSD